MKRFVLIWVGLSVCHSFSWRDDRFYRYIGVNFTLGLLDCDRYIWDIVIPSRIVKSGFCSIYFTVTLAGLKKY